MKAITVDKRTDGVAVLTLDTPLSPVNTLSRELLEEFRAAFQDIVADRSVVACVLASGKRDSFIAGANLHEFLRFRAQFEGEEFSRTGHRLLDAVADCPKPFVAAIHGPALGGGLELALACRYRVASDHPKTVLALPEVTLGLLPGGGGTQRLPRLIGLRRALPLLLTGRRVRAREARKMGLVDALAPAASVVEIAAVSALRLASGALRRQSPQRPILDQIFELPLVRSLVLARARKEVIAKTRKLYPAPPAILSCVETGLESGERAGLEAESVLFGKLAVGPESHAMINLFLGMNELKKAHGRTPPRPVNEVAIVGAGFMGAGIASVSTGVTRVVLKDVSLEAVGRGVKVVSEGFAHRVRSGSLTRLEADIQRSRLAATTRLEDLRGVDLVIEAVYEDLDLKRRVLAEAEERIGDEAVFASNTSAIPISEIASGARHPERVLGMHYFSPVHKMQLLEVVVTPKTADWATETARAFGAAQGKTVIVVKDGPGFYTTRILAPYINEAVTLLEEGADIRALDRAMQDFGFPVGPVALMDEVGIDVGAHVSDFLGSAFENRGLGASDALRQLAAAGYAGRKNGRGFYRYDGAKREAKEVNDSVYSFFGGHPRIPIPPRDMIDRLALLMVNEAVYCLQEDIVESPLAGDLGAILGLGFPPLRGGPFRYIDIAGARWVVDRMAQLEHVYGSRFRPARLLLERAETSTRFYAADDGSWSRP